MIKFKKCHSSHMQIQKNKVKVTLSFKEDSMWAIYGLAQKYTDGCLERFLMACIMGWLETEMGDELKGSPVLGEPQSSESTQNKD